MNASGWIMIIVTIVLFFRPEYSSLSAQKAEEESLKKMNLYSVYRDMWKIIKLPSMKMLFVILLTSKLAFSAADNISLLKLSEKGFPQEMMALSVVITFPFEIFFPIILGKLAQKSPHKTLGPVSIVSLQRLNLLVFNI
jgi:MFS transporter, PAT family, solute carrier family 33 (acetyl-CoA transportor), member 1